MYQFGHNGFNEYVRPKRCDEILNPALKFDKLEGLHFEAVQAYLKARREGKRSEDPRGPIPPYPVEYAYCFNLKMWIPKWVVKN